MIVGLSREVNTVTLSTVSMSDEDMAVADCIVDVPEELVKQYADAINSFLDASAELKEYMV